MLCDSSLAGCADSTTSLVGLFAGEGRSLGDGFCAACGLWVPGVVRRRLIRAAVTKARPDAGSAEGIRERATEIEGAPIAVAPIDFGVRRLSAARSQHMSGHARHRRPRPRRGM